jgi:hypothetical protein
MKGALVLGLVTLLFLIGFGSFAGVPAPSPVVVPTINTSQGGTKTVKKHGLVLNF